MNYFEETLNLNLESSTGTVAALTTKWITVEEGRSCLISFNCVFSSLFRCMPWIAYKKMGVVHWFTNDKKSPGLKVHQFPLNLFSGVWNYTFHKTLCTSMWITCNYLTSRMEWWSNPNLSAISEKKVFYIHIHHAPLTIYILQVKNKIRQWFTELCIK